MNLYLRFYMYKLLKSLGTKLELEKSLIFEGYEEHLYSIHMHSCTNVQQTHFLEVTNYV